MARKKNYSEQEVIEKATALFWRNGYEATSVRMLEKEMGINQFSIYASFKNKEGVFLESIKCYKSQVKCLSDKLSNSINGIEGIKEYFYEFVKFSQEQGEKKGCLVVNTFNELGQNSDPLIMAELVNFSNEIRAVFLEALKQEKMKDDEVLQEKANFLIIAMQGLASASRVNSQKELDDYIKFIFKSL